MKGFLTFQQCRTGFFALLQMVLTAQLAGCSSVSSALFGSDPSPVLEQPALTGVLKLLVHAADYVNPDIHGQPCPVVVRLYQMNDCDILQKFRFLDLYREADHFLGARLLAERELPVMHPGQVLQLNLPLVKGAGCLAALSGFSRYQEGHAMAWLPVTGSAQLQVRVEGLRIVLTRSD